MSSFSQTDTTNQQTNIPTTQSDTTKIRLKVPVAKLVIKDILKGDGCQLELKETQVKVIKLETREKEKDSHIVFLEEKYKNNNFMLGSPSMYNILLLKIYHPKLFAFQLFTGYLYM